MFALKYIVIGTLIALACVVGTVSLSSGLAPPPPAEPHLALVVSLVVLCFFLPPFVASVVLRRGNFLHDLAIVVVLVGLLFALQFGTDSWFLVLALCVFSFIGGWAGRRVSHVSAT